MQGRTLGGSDWEWTGSRVGARLEGKSKQRSEIKGSEACGFFSVCVSGPVAQHWSRLAPTGMQLPSDPQAASCPTRRWPPGKGGRTGVETRLTQPKSQTKANLSDLPQEGPGGGQGTEKKNHSSPANIGLLSFAGRSEDGN